MSIYSRSLNPAYIHTGRQAIENSKQQICMHTSYMVLHMFVDIQRTWSSTAVIIRSRHGVYISTHPRERDMKRAFLPIEDHLPLDILPQRLKKAQRRPCRDATVQPHESRLTVTRWNVQIKRRDRTGAIAADVTGQQTQAKSSWDEKGRERRGKWGTSATAMQSWMVKGTAHHV